MLSEFALRTAGWRASGARETRRGLCLVARLLRYQLRMCRRIRLTGEAGAGLRDVQIPQCLLAHPVPECAFFHRRLGLRKMDCEMDDGTRESADSLSACSSDLSDQQALSTIPADRLNSNVHGFHAAIIRLGRTHHHAIWLPVCIEMRGSAP